MRGSGVEKRGGWQEHEQSIPPTGYTRSYHSVTYCNALIQDHSTCFVCMFACFFLSFNHYLNLFGCNFILIANLAYTSEIPLFYHSYITFRGFGQVLKLE